MARHADSGEVKESARRWADISSFLIFPNIGARNTFYKTVSLFGDAKHGVCCEGTASPVVVPSRADSGNSKYYSLAAVLPDK